MFNQCDLSLKFYSKRIISSIAESPRNRDFAFSETDFAIYQNKIQYHSEKWYERSPWYKYNQTG